MSQIWISEITLCNFRAFATPPSGFSIAIPQKGHLLVYGENGAGKSSLFLALKCFFEHCGKTKSFVPYQNIFRPDESGWVRLKLSDGSVKTWPPHADDSTPDPEVWTNADKIKATFDYRALLQTHFMPTRPDEVDLFDLFFVHPDGLLRGLTNDAAKVTFGRNWDVFASLVTKQKHTTNQKTKIERVMNALNAGIGKILPRLEEQTNEFLKFFDDGMQVAFETQGAYKASYSGGSERKPISGKIRTQVTFNGQPLFAIGGDGVSTRHQELLNEARLSALAISIFLAARKLEPTKGLRLLALDDVLIGLDMSNRLKMLELLKKHFIGGNDGYQLILTTYDRAWFEAVKRWATTTDTKPDQWGKVEIFAGNWGDNHFPVVRTGQRNNSLLDRARAFHDDHEYKAAAVYVRTQFERMLKEFCADKKVPVPYCEAPNQPSAEQLWKALETWLKEKKSPLENAVRFAVEESKAIVMNPSAHDDPLQPFPWEVDKSIRALESLSSALDSLRRTS